MNTSQPIGSPKRLGSKDASLVSSMPIFIAFLLVLAYQGRDFLISPQFWAEDGAIFFQQQLGHSFPVLFQPYAGYIHFAPRIATWVASAWSYERQPGVTNALAWLFAAWSLAFAAQRLKRIVPAALTLIIITFTPTSGETVGTITNVQWYLQFALAVMVFVPTNRPLRPAISFTLALVLALSGASSIFIALLVLAMALIVVATPTPILPSILGELSAYLKSLEISTLAGTCVGAFIQAIVVIALPAKVGTHHGAYLPALHDLMGALLPIHLIGEPILPGKAWLFIYLCLGYMLAFGKNIRPHTKIAISALFAIGLAVALAGVTRLAQPYDLRFDFSDRYYALARVAFWWFLYTAVAACWNSKTQAAVATATLVVFFGMVSPQLHRRWAFADLRWSQQMQEISTPGRHSIPINPAPFTIEVDTDTSGRPHGTAAADQ